jgi:hypothetical protein
MIYPPLDACFLAQVDPDHNRSGPAETNNAPDRPRDGSLYRMSAMIETMQTRRP